MERNTHSKHSWSRASAVRLAGVLVLVAGVSVVVQAAMPVLFPAAAPVVSALGAGSVPLQINHQGVVVVSGVRFNGTGEFRFALVDPDTGNNVWTNNGSSVGTSTMPDDSVPVSVVNGIYSISLGGDPGLPTMVAIPASVFDDGNLVLRIWFDDGTNGVEQLNPDHVLGSVPYAYRAATVDACSLPSGVIVMWSGTIATIPEGWALCDGNDGTPDLTSRFVMSVPNASTDPGATGGSSAHTHGPGSYSGAGHTHTYHGQTSVFHWNVRREGDQWDSGSTGTHSHSYSGTTDPVGAGSITGTSGEAANLPPYYVVAFIMRL